MLIARRASSCTPGASSSCTSSASSRVRSASSGFPFTPRSPAAGSTRTTAVSRLGTRILRQRNIWLLLTRASTVARQPRTHTVHGTVRSLVHDTSWPLLPPRRLPSVLPFSPTPHCCTGPAVTGAFFSYHQLWRGRRHQRGERAVHFIADEGAAEGSHLGPDLVRAPGVQLNAHLIRATAVQRRVSSTLCAASAGRPPHHPCVRRAAAPWGAIAGRRARPVQLLAHDGQR